MCGFFGHGESCFKYPQFNEIYDFTADKNKSYPH